MTTNKTANRSQSSSSTLVNVIAVCLVLVTLGYGMVKIAERSSSLPNQRVASKMGGDVMLFEQAMASDLGDQTMPLGPQADLRNAQPATNGSLPATTLGERIDDPRECALDKGINTACVFY